MVANDDGSFASGLERDGIDDGGEFPAVDAGDVVDIGWAGGEDAVGADGRGRGDADVVVVVPGE